MIIINGFLFNLLQILNLFAERVVAVKRGETVTEAELSQEERERKREYGRASGRQHEIVSPVV